MKFKHYSSLLVLYSLFVLCRLHLQILQDDQQQQDSSIIAGSDERKEDDVLDTETDDDQNLRKTRTNESKNNLLIIMEEKIELQAAEIANLKEQIEKLKQECSSNTRRMKKTTNPATTSLKI